MSRRALWLAVAIGMSSSAAARADRPDFRADGSVLVGARAFPTRAAYYASPEFQQRGARCGSEPGPAIDLHGLHDLHDPSALVAADCSFQSTMINPAYEDDREIVIQVVFHVIKRSDGVGHIPTALIHSQIDVLNEDFGALPGSLGAPGTDTKIRFVLARFDPSGKPTTGIEVVTNDGYFKDPGSGDSPMKTALRWDPTRYLNIYTNDGNGNLGYATFPQTQAGAVQDGIVLLWETVGRNSLGGPPFHLGRTATHEVGHYLGLFHTFQGSCGSATAPYTSGDLISDTPRERLPSYGCTPSVSACQGAGMNPIENYMNYSDDACMNRFTPEQRNRMRCAIMSYRNVNTAPRARFTHAVAGAAVTFTNASTDAESPLAMLQSRWTFGDGKSSTDASPTHTYAAPGTYQVTLEVVDPGSGASTVTQAVDVVIAPAAPGGGDGGDDGDPDEGVGCCQAPGGHVSFLVCALPVALVLRRRRRA
jgi:hypothetical protein